MGPNKNRLAIISMKIVVRNLRIRDRRVALISRFYWEGRVGLPCCEGSGFSRWARVENVPSSDGGAVQQRVVSLHTHTAAQFAKWHDFCRPTARLQLGTTQCPNPSSDKSTYPMSWGVHRIPTTTPIRTIKEIRLHVLSPPKLDAQFSPYYFPHQQRVSVGFPIFH